MQATRNPPALADAADVLSSQLWEHLQHLAKFLLPHVGILERRFLLKLRRLRFDAKQRTALAAITPFAASGILAPGRPLSDFFEQVEYNGRRLAKLALPPSRIVEALRESDGLLKPVFGALPEREGVLEETHPSLFVVKVDEKRNRTARVSYSYVDVLTGTVELSHCESGESLFPWLN